MTEKNIIENPCNMTENTVVYTDENMECDMDFYMAERMTQNLFEDGLITEDEYQSVVDEHIKNYNPTLAYSMR